MTDAAFSSLAETCLRARGAWHWFFHGPCDARVCALVRIAFAMLVMVNFAALYSDLGHWFTGEGVLPQAASREVISPHAWSILWLLPDTRAAVETCYWIAVGNAALLLLGVFPRLNALCLFIWLVSFDTRNSLITDGEDDVFKMIAFCLIWMPSGVRWSLTAVARRWWSKEAAITSSHVAVPGWGLRLLQLEMVMIFLSAGLSKLGGDAWLDGTALYYVARLDDFFGRFPVPDWPWDTPWVVAVLTWSVLAIELGVPIFIWFRETRYICLLLVLLFHLGNEWTMHLFLFHWIMLCGWLAFATTDDLRWLWFSESQGNKSS
jgi:HTTM domain